MISKTLVKIGTEEMVRKDVDCFSERHLAEGAQHVTVDSSRLVPTHTGDDEGDVVVELGHVLVTRDLLIDPMRQFPRGLASRAKQSVDPVQTELRAVLVRRFGQPVGIEEEHVARFEPELARDVAPTAEYADREAGRRELLDLPVIFA